MTNHSKYVAALTVLVLLTLFNFSGCKNNDTREPFGDLEISINADKSSVTINDTITYVVKVKNNGPDVSNNVYVDFENLTSEITLISSEVSMGDLTLSSEKWVIGTLAKDEYATLSLKTLISNLDDISFNASVTGDALENNMKNNISYYSLDLSDFSLTKEQKWSFEIYNVMKEIYLWNDALPNSFDPTKYATAEDALEYLIGLKINASTGKPIDRYSFLDSIGELSSEIETGNTGDYGFMINFAYKSDGEISAFVVYVYANSSAGLAGVTRSCELIGIDGSSDVHLKVDSDGYIIHDSAYNRIINAVYNSVSAKFTFRRVDGTEFDADLTKVSYAINSVLYNNVYTTASGKKVGYMVYNSFLGNTSVNEIKSTISNFASNGVEYLVVDLRYNGGGSVATCSEFCNQVAPASANNNVMFRYIENDLLMAQHPAEYFTVYFNKTNSFSPKKIYFIVTENTASASELLINNLKPYFNGSLYLIGEKTYGKPCGFWSVPIGYVENQAYPKEGYDLYAVSFETVNANGEGKYFNGIEPDVEAYDGLRYQWGDTEESSFAQALNHIENGQFISYSKKSKVQSIRSDFDRRFKGMIDFSHKNK